MLHLYYYEPYLKDLYRCCKKKGEGVNKDILYYVQNRSC